MKRLAQLMLTRFFLTLFLFAHILSLHSIRHNEYEQYIFFGNKEDEWMCQGCEMLAWFGVCNEFEYFWKLVVALFGLKVFFWVMWRSFLLIVMGLNLIWGSCCYESFGTFWDFFENFEVSLYEWRSKGDVTEEGASSDTI